MVRDDEASETLKREFDRVRAPSGNLDNVMRIHSLRPHTMHAHYALYMSVLHHDANTLPAWLLETIATYTSLLNASHYSFTNHWANARHLIADDARAQIILDALEADAPERAFEGRELAMLRYARVLTLSPCDVCETDINAMKIAGVDDGEILEVNQVCSYFNYVNRLLNGLGVSLEGDVVGYYPDSERSESGGERGG